MPERGKPMVPLTEREMRMLVSLVEAEYREANLLVARWENTPDDAAEAENVSSVEEQRMYFRGLRTGVSSIKTLIEGVLNA